MLASGRTVWSRILKTIVRTLPSYARWQSEALPPLGTQRELSFSLIWERCLSAVFHRTVKALLERFSKYIAGDISAIPVDLLDVAFCTVGGLILNPVSDSDTEELTVLGRQAYRCPNI